MVAGGNQQDAVDHHEVSPRGTPQNKIDLAHHNGIPAGLRLDDSLVKNEYRLASGPVYIFVGKKSAPVTAGFLASVALRRMKTA